jgi:YggT family protein
MNLILAQFVSIAVQVLTWLVFIDVILSFFLQPYHPVRETLDRIVEPLLAPIRRFMPQTGMFDFTPLVFLLLVQLLGNMLVNVLLTL